ncbi:MAG: twin-arginine translocase subunit TatC [Myxococcales bacterium]|nr:twin-arginine translocase subunit TatC [Myxococcales bacterium]
MAASASTDPEPVDERRMPFTEHLAELRDRLRNSVLGVIAATVIAYLFKEALFALMARPLVIAWGEAKKTANLPPLEIVFTNPIDSVMVYIKLAMLAGVFGASPVIFHQIWRFIAPGLYARERRLALPFVIASVVLFFGGAMFCYTFVLPSGYEYFLSFSSDSMGVMKEFFGQQVDFKLTETFTIRPMITLDEYFGLTSTLLLLFGAVFELPLLLSVLAMIGLVTPRGLWRFNRYAILIFFVLGAMLTPGDLVVGQVAMGGALTVLYNLSIVAALLVGRKKKGQEPVEPASLSE